MLGLKVNKKLLQNHLSKIKVRGQVILLKELHNIAASSKDSSRSGIEAINELKKVPGK